MAGSKTVWLFDLDNTLHDASHAAFGATNRAMTEYMVEHLGLDFDAASALRQHYCTTTAPRCSGWCAITVCVLRTSSSRRTACPNSNRSCAPARTTASCCDACPAESSS